MEKRKIILDCDPGHDDAIAIMMAAKHPAIDLLGITIVAGNQTLDKTLINGLNVCQKLEINVPVYAGMPQPIMRQQIVADNIHGETGLDGPVFEPLTRQAESTHAVKYIIDNGIEICHLYRYFSFEKIIGNTPGNITFPGTNRSPKQTTNMISFHFIPVINIAFGLMHYRIWHICIFKCPLFHSALVKTDARISAD